MKTIGNNVQLYPLKENRYKLVGLLIAHVRKIVHEASNVDLFRDQSVSPDRPRKVDDPVKLAIKDYLSERIESC